MSPSSSQYISTRGQARRFSFLEAIYTGQPADGGLLVPAVIPHISGEQLEAWRGLDYEALCAQIVTTFVDDIPQAELQNLIKQSYASFSHPDIALIQPLSDRFVLELFHGPTLAFKDFGLQFLGQLFAFVLKRQGGEMNIICATSGDTGSAAIAGLQGKAHLRVFVMHPDGRPSLKQRLQMTTVLDENIVNFAIEGSFDDCQRILKELLADQDFKQTHQVSTVNSINWGRILAQTVYYFYAYLKVTKTPGEQVVFATPTGNFGNLLSGYIAAKMGLPVAKLILATNKNDILASFFNSSQYRRGVTHHTLSPAMDIQVASNLERYLYWYFDGDTKQVQSFMHQFHETGSAHFDTSAPFDALITARTINDQKTAEAMARIWRTEAYPVDPHTAVGMAAADQVLADDPDLRRHKLICLATAHPAKFPEAVSAATGEAAISHPTLDALSGLPERFVVLPAEKNAVMDRIKSAIAGSR